MRRIRGSVLFAVVFIFAFLAGRVLIGRFESAPVLVAESSVPKAASSSVPATPQRIAKAKPVAPSENWPEMLSTAKGAKLFTVLFDRDFPRRIETDDEARELLLARLSEALPQDRQKHDPAGAEAEVVSRLGILKAMTEVRTPDLLTTYTSLLKSDTPMIIRRQALRNALAWGGHLTEKQRNEFLALADARTRGLASMTEDELLRKATHADVP